MSIWRNYEQDCDNYVNPSLKHELHLQRVKKPTLSQLDDKRRYKKLN